MQIELARRLAVHKQLLAGPRRPADAHGILDVTRTIGRLQLDPTSAVARSHLLVLWSRLGPYDPAELDRLLWDERSLFEYRAFIVPTEDYALFEARMREFPAGESARSRQIRAWLETNAELRDTVLAQLAERGPLRLRDFTGAAAAEPWRSAGWTDDRNTSQMLEFLWGQGRVLVAGRQGQQRVWGLPERCLPREVLDQPPLPVEEAALRRLERSLRECGIAAPGDIPLTFFLPGGFRPADLLTRLADDGRAERVQVQGLPGDWYVHVDDLPLLDRLGDGDWGPRTTLLSPFDNLIYDRDRTERLFGFRFRLEIYVPKDKREYGYFVMPVLHGDRLVGRLDPKLDRKARVLTINAVHAEPDAPPEATPEIAGAVSELARFLGAESVVYPQRLPAAWVGLRP